jgi:two-component system, OmpR family, phosphate regulon sensor histidine kinase PhoR
MPDRTGLDRPDANAVTTASLAEVLAVLPDAAMLVDANGIVVAFNGTASTLFPGVRSGALASGTLRNPEFQELLARTGVAGSIERENITQRVPLERRLAITVGGVRMSGRPGIARLVTVQDLTERDRVERMRTDFIANASHELRTPLSAVIGFIETLQGPARDDAAAREKFLGIMAREASRMQRLIDDLLRLTRVEMHEHIRPNSDVDLAALAATVVAGMEPLAAAVPMRLLVAAPERALVRGDADELTQVVQNLVQNALRYGRQGGTTTVSVAREQGKMVLSVSDDGPGIPPEHLPRLTERFYRVEGKAGRDRSGTGLGLAIVKHIVARHGGDLRITSLPGEGATFAVSLPGADATATGS